LHRTAGRAPGRAKAGPRPLGGPADVLVGRGVVGRAPGRSQAGPRPLGGPVDVLVGRGVVGRAPGRSQAGPRPLGGPADVLVGRGVVMSRGFTLIEVMVALAIVAITLGAGIKAAGALADNAARLTDVSLAQWCADNELTGLRL